MEPSKARTRARVDVELVASAARGRSVRLVTIRPAGTSADLPVCLFLHCRYADARHALHVGVPERLDDLVAAGGRPFAVAAVDGGDAYWHPRGPDDPLRMLTHEVPRWLADRGLALASSGRPRVAFGISMGAFGALLYARARAAPALGGMCPAGLRAAAVVSPALFATWGEARIRRAFADRADWAEHEPLLRLGALNGLPLGVWCGTDDHLVPVARRLARALPGVSAHIGPGDHTNAYWSSVVPGVLGFLSRHV